MLLVLWHIYILMSIYLHLDIGNTAIKWQFNLGNKQQTKGLLINKFLVEQLPELPYDCPVFICVVAHFFLIDNIKKYYAHCQIHLVQTTKQYKNLINAYDEVEQLGVDRWLGLIATYEKYPKRNVLLISLGTATTLDVLPADGQHQGGLIMPSLALSKQSLPRFTSDKDLSNNTFIAPKKTLANNTVDAWQFGCELLWSEGLGKIIHYFAQTYEIDLLVITGGYSSSKMTFLDLPYQYHDNLVLLGLSYYQLGTLKNDGK